MKKACQVTVQKQAEGDEKAAVRAGNPPIPSPENN